MGKFLELADEGQDATLGLLGSLGLFNASHLKTGKCVETGVTSKVRQKSRWAFLPHYCQINVTIFNQVDSLNELFHSFVVSVRMELDFENQLEEY